MRGGSPHKETATHRQVQASKNAQMSTVASRPVETRDATEDTPNESTSERSFAPFFVLVRYALTGEYHHPHVHYVFADDEPDGLNDAVIDNLGAPEATTTHTGRLQEKERHLIIDLASNARAIAAVRSLSSSWQPSDAAISAAPTFDHEASQSNSMLIIEGKESRGATQGKDVLGFSRDVRLDPAATDMPDLIVRLESLASEFHHEIGRLQGLNYMSITKE